MIKIADHTRLLTKAQTVILTGGSATADDAQLPTLIADDCGLPDAPLVMPLQNLDPAPRRPMRMRTWRPGRIARS